MLDFPIHFKLNKKNRKLTLKDSKTSNDDHENNLSDSKLAEKVSDSNDWMRIFSRENILRKYGNKKVYISIGSKQFYEIEWSEESIKVEATLQQFANWIDSNCDNLSSQTCRNDHNCKIDLGPLKEYPKRDYWAYLSYQRIFELFKDDSNHEDEFLECKPWLNIFKKFSKNSTKSGKNLNLWWGSKGSYTPCHFDSYGINMVFQVSGKKLWILFPPQDYHKMYPTRLPYEDSSIFSQVDPIKPNLQRFPQFKNASSHAIIMEQGDCLFIPKHWWHYVENLSDSLSLNCWFDLDCDIFDRRKEISTCIQVNMLINGATIRDKWIMDLLNLNQETIKSQIIINKHLQNSQSREKYRKQHGIGSNPSDFLCTCTSMWQRTDKECDEMSFANRMQPFFMHQHCLPELDFTLKDPKLFGINFLMPIVPSVSMKSDISKQSISRMKKSGRALLKNKAFQSNLEFYPNLNDMKMEKSKKSSSSKPTITALKEYINEIADFANLDYLRHI